MKRRLKISYKSLALVLVVAFCLFLLPAPTHAQGSYEPSPGVFSCVTNPVDCMLYFVRSMLVTLIALVGSGIDIALRAPIAGIPVVVSSWEIVRGFANMFFILALIIMAFATIFSISKYDFRTLIARFLIAALLINFSLVIGEIIIDWSTSLSNVFLDAIGNVGDRLAQGANIAKHLDSGGLSQATSPVSQVSWGQTMVNAVNIVMLSILFFSLTVLLFFSIIRIPILWALLIVSPIAWITYILPTTMNINRKWWNEFIAWNVFMPVYLFFIYFGVLFLNNQQQVLANTSGPLISGFSTAFQDIFFYLLIGLFLIGGAKFAISSSRSAGARTVAAGIWAKGRATARFTGSRVPVPVLTGKPWKKDSWTYGTVGEISGAAQQRFEQAQRKGLFGIGGTESGEKRQAGIAGRFGVEGVDLQRFNKGVETYSKQMRDKKIYDDQSRLADEMNSNDPSRIVAAGKLLKEFHVDEFDKEQVKKIFGAYSSVSIAEGSKFLAGLNYDKMSADDLEDLKNADEFKSIPYRQEFLARITDAQIKKGRYRDATAYKSLLGNYSKQDDVLDALKKTDKEFLDGLSGKENNDLFDTFKGMPDVQKFIAERMLKKGHFNPDQLRQIFADKDKGGLYDTDFERNRALKSAEEKRLMTVLRIRKELGIFDKKEDGTPRTYEEMLENRTSKMGAENILKLAIDTKELEDGKKEELLAALDKMLRRSPKRINSIISSKDYTGEYQELYGEMFDKVMAETSSQRTAKLNIRKPGGGGGTPPSTPPSGGNTPPSSPQPQPKPKPTPVYIPNPTRPSGGSRAIPEFEPTRPAPPQHLGGPTVIGEPPKQEIKKDEPRTFEQSGIKRGQKIKVQRTAGNIEDGWEVMDFSWVEGVGGLVRVVKSVPGMTSPIEKQVPWKEFKELNP